MRKLLGGEQNFNGVVIVFFEENWTVENMFFSLHSNTVGGGIAQCHWCIPPFESTRRRRRNHRGVLEIFVGL